MHAWAYSGPEIWDGDNSGMDGASRIEDSPNEDYRHQGPDTWAQMIQIGTSND